jgi:glycosyltransferase involved in cell wall biosynthesis
MDIAIVAPCPVPYVIGGAENLWRGLQDYINDETPHQAEIIKLPSREHSFWELLDSYRRFSELDLAGFDVVVSSKYPAWMAPHERHVLYLLHKLRGLYDTYHFLGLPDALPDAPANVIELREWMREHAGERAALPEFFARVGRLRGHVPDDFPGPLIRELVHWLDDVGLAGMRRYGALSHTVRARENHFPDGAEVFVVHPPTALEGLGPGRDGGYLFTASRLDGPKRMDLLVQAMKGVDAELRIAGTGPQEAMLREMAPANVRFCGRVSGPELAALYRGARAVAFVPYAEDYGYITLEAMLCGKPVITCDDAGGPTELVEDGVSGRVVPASPEAIAAAVRALWKDRRGRRRMGAAARERAASIQSWAPLVNELTA